ncbi:MAG TPA: hypothetical protein VFA52_01185 [Candidatus Paceibacterota bacterium]|nr:hypothetical protein [Candidatus Paceibacterota bacterium]
MSTLHTVQSSKLFDSKKAEEFARENFYVLSDDIFSAPNTLPLLHRPRSSYIHCIDDRHPRNILGIPVPGAVLSFNASFIASLEKIEKEIGQILYSSPFTIMAVEEMLGPPSYHSDQSRAKNPDNLPCQGCGHAFGAVDRPEEYFLSEDMANILVDYIKSLPEKGVRPLLYEGGHEKARAVFIITNPHLSMHHQSSDGSDHAYIYHQYWHMELIDRLARRLSIVLKNLSRGKLDEENLAKVTKEVASKQLDSTVTHLGADRLPRFILGGSTAEDFEFKMVARQS